MELLQRTCILFLFAISASSLELQVPSGNTLKPGTTFTMKCIAGQTDQVQVERHISGNIWVIIGSDGQLHEPFNANTKYRMTAERNRNQYTYTFSITDSKYEDTAFYRCKIRVPQAQSTTPQEKQTVLAICDDLDSSECGCVHLKGMYEPICFRDADTDSELGLHRTITGLIVCLVIAIVIAIAFAAVAGLDCVKRMNEKRKKAAAEAARASAAKQSGRSPYDDTERLELDPNDTESNPYYNNVGYAPDDDEGFRSAELKVDTRPNGTPGSRGVRTPSTSTSTNPLPNGYHPRDALDPRNLSAFKFPKNNNNRNSPTTTQNGLIPQVSSQPGKSPGNFSAGSGDPDLLKNRGSYAASPRDAYPVPKDIDHYTDPRRLDVVNQPETPKTAQTYEPPPLRDYEMKPSTMI